jgi:hypothetical protein
MNVGRAIRYIGIEIVELLDKLVGAEWEQIDSRLM